MTNKLLDLAYGIAQIATAVKGGEKALKRVLLDAITSGETPSPIFSTAMVTKKDGLEHAVRYAIGADKGFKNPHIPQYDKNTLDFTGENAGKGGVTVGFVQFFVLRKDELSGLQPIQVGLLTSKGLLRIGARIVQEMELAFYGGLPSGAVVRDGGALARRGERQRRLAWEGV